MILSNISGLILVSGVCRDCKKRGRVLKRAKEEEEKGKKEFLDLIGKFSLN